MSSSIFLIDNKYVYKNPSYLIYRDGLYYPAKMSNYSGMLSLKDKSHNVEYTVLTKSLNAYISDVITYHYIYSLNSTVGQYITLKCYADDELVHEVTFRRSINYAYPMTTFFINKHVNVYKETITITGGSSTITTGNDWNFQFIYHC